MSEVAKALEQQVKHLREHWPVPSEVTVKAFTHGQEPSKDVWLMKLVDRLQKDHGFHYNEHGVPNAKVVFEQDWSIAASHEFLEMLVDPTANRLQVGEAVRVVEGHIRKADGYVQYLVEVSDPCEAVDYAYEIGGIKVSDFVTPEFYGAESRGKHQYDYKGHLHAPRTIGHGGYLTWVHPKPAEVRQMIWLDPNGQPKIRALGELNMPRVRTFVDGQTHPLLRAARNFPFKFKIHPGGTTKAFKCNVDHWVTYRDGEGRIEIHREGASSRQEQVKKHEPVHRPAGQHWIRNLDQALLHGDKDLIDPKTLR